jgi:predicted glycosyltransferase
MSWCRRTRDAQRTILSLRGVLFGPEKTHREYFGEPMAQWILETFDAIHVHTDPRVFRLEDLYELPTELAARTRYTGYLAGPPSVSRVEARAAAGVAPSERLLVASMGGGQGALPIWSVILDSLAALTAPPDRAVLVTGPYLEPEEAAALASRTAALPWADVRVYVPNLPALMLASDVFLGAAGSNMLGEILATGCNAVIIPRQVREPEQRLHARRLADLGLVRMCDLHELSSRALTDLLVDAFANPLRSPSWVRLDGARRYPEFLAAHTRSEFNAVD